MQSAAYTVHTTQQVGYWGKKDKWHLSVIYENSLILQTYIKGFEDLLGSLDYTLNNAALEEYVDQQQKTPK